MVFFFIHTPRTSGTTLVDVLSRGKNHRIGYFYPHDKEIVDLEKRIKETPYYHLKRNPDWRKFNFIVGHFTFGIHEIFRTEEFSYIGVVRNPVTHYFSVFKAFELMSTAFRQHAFQGVKIDSLEDALKPEFALQAQNMQTFFFSGLAQDEIRKDKERALSVAIQNIEQYFAVVFPVEYFDERLIYMERKIGIKPTYYKRKNTTGNFNGVLPSHIINQIKQLNDLDERLYQYCRHRFEAKIAKIPGLKLKTGIFKLNNVVSNILKRTS